ncbi:hypothetical protein QQ045_021285 [Rhodiola kirilowii]
MAVSSSCFVKPLLSSSPFQCRSDQDFSGFPKVENASQQPSSRRLFGAGVPVRAYGLSSLILRFPPNFVMQLSTKARRNCSNIGFAQIVAASWSDEGNKGVNDKAVVVAAASSAAAVDEDICSNGSGCSNGVNDKTYYSSCFRLLRWLCQRFDFGYSASYI